MADVEKLGVIGAGLMGNGIAHVAALSGVPVVLVDVNPAALEKAQAGIYGLDRIQQFTENHRLAGGKRSLSDYYTAAYGAAVFDKSLRRRAVFAEHNLASDEVFAEVQLVSSRNVLIYFDKDLQERVHGLFYESLARFGILALGAKESLKFSKYEDCYEPVSPRDKIYRKVR